MIGGRPASGTHETAALLNLVSRVPSLASVWVGTLDLVHLDAPVRVLRPEPLDPLHRLLLRAIAVAPAALDQLDARLALGRGPLFHWLSELLAVGLIRFNDHYALTPAGTTALADGVEPRLITERRRFTFVLGADGGAHFVPWMAAAKAPIPAPAADTRWLTECVVRPAAWKRRIGFPEDVAGIEKPSDGSGMAAWRRLAVATGEQPAVALVLTGDRPGRLLGFVGDSDLSVPLLHFDGGWEEAFPELLTDPTTPRTEIGDGWALLGDGRLRRAVQTV
jgi:hypothetical protein